MTFGIFFTGMPICYMCSNDWQYDKEKLMSEPHLYKIGLKNQCFSNMIFARWYFYAIWQSILLVYLSFYTFQETSFGFSTTLDTDSYNEGCIMDSLDLTGVSIMQALIMVVNFKLISSSFNHTFGSLFWQLGSIISFYLMFIILSRFEYFDSPLFGVFNILMHYRTYYLLLFIFVVGYVLVDSVCEGINHLLE